MLRNPEDDHSKNVFDPSIRGRTDRFVYRFRRPRARVRNGPSRARARLLRGHAGHGAELARHMGLVGEALRGGMVGERGLVRHLLERLLEAEQPEIAARRQADMAREPALQRARAHAGAEAHLLHAGGGEDRAADRGEPSAAGQPSLDLVEAGPVEGKPAAAQRGQRAGRRPVTRPRARA